MNKARRRFWNLNGFAVLSLVWFRSDLRIHDHPALVRAAQEGRVLPVFIADPEIWAGRARSARQWEFVAECVEDLAQDLAHLGQPLLIRTDRAVEVLKRLWTKHRFEQILTMAEPPDPRRAARDREVAAWAQSVSVPWHDCGMPRDGAIAPPPETLPPVAEASGAMPSARALKLSGPACPSRQAGGRRQADMRLSGFVQSRVQRYARAEGQLIGADKTSSRLSPHLVYGTLSHREVRAALAEFKATQAPCPEWRASARRFERQLRLSARFEDELREEPSRGEAQHLAAWCAGETGLPFVDACLRALQETGWLSSPARGFLASVATHVLELGPSAAGDHVARLSTDYEAALFWPNWTGVATKLRPMDPVSIGERADPDGRFLRQWLPELAGVPARYVHRPWLWSQARQRLAGRYPDPVVDPATALKAARQRAARSRTSPARLARPRISAAQMRFEFVDGGQDGGLA